jgi:hypothetical protein
MGQGPRPWGRAEPHKKQFALVEMWVSPGSRYRLLSQPGGGGWRGGITVKFCTELYAICVPHFRV